MDGAVEPRQRRTGRIMVCVYLLVSIPLSACDECTKVSSCACDCDIGDIDLAGIAVTTGPLFKDLPDPQNEYKYSYNPCHPFTETSPGAFEEHCNDVAACQVIASGGAFQYYNIGTQDSVMFSTEKGNTVGMTTDDKVIVAKYTESEGAGGVSRQSEVVIVCSDTGTILEVVGELPQQGIPTFVCLLIVYAVGGVVYNKSVRGARGRELAPNWGFWSAIPGLIRDGFLFIGNRGRKTAYEEVK